MIVYSTQIHALGSAKYKLRCPLLVTIQQYDRDNQYPGEVVAHISEFGLYGSAVSGDLALMRLKDEIVSTYERLNELAYAQLGPLALHHLEAMRAVIQEASG